MIAVLAGRVRAGILVLWVVPACAAACVRGTPVDNDPGLRDVLRIAGEVFEVTDWNSSAQLDHLQLLNDASDAALDAQTAALMNDRAGYLCAGMATYLSRTLSRQGYRNLVYNSGAGDATHVVTLVEIGDQLYVFDVFAGSVARRDGAYLTFDAFLQSLLDRRHADFSALFQPLDPALRKTYLRQLTDPVSWPSASADEVSRSIGSPAIITRRHDDGTLDIEVDDPGRGFSGCQITPAGRLSCRKSPPDYPVYAELERGIEERTGVTDALFLLPLNLESRDQAYFLAKYPYLQVLDRYAPKARALDGIDPPDRQAFASLVAAFTHDLQAALGTRLATVAR